MGGGSTMTGTYIPQPVAGYDDVEPDGSALAGYDDTFPNSTALFGDVPDAIVDRRRRAILISMSRSRINDLIAARIYDFVNTEFNDLIASRICDFIIQPDPWSFDADIVEIFHAMFPGSDYLSPLGHSVVEQYFDLGESATILGTNTSIRQSVTVPVQSVLKDDLVFGMVSR
jgi:hypothetical protein